VGVLGKRKQSEEPLSNADLTSLLSFLLHSHSYHHIIS